MGELEALRAGTMVRAQHKADAARYRDEAYRNAQASLDRGNKDQSAEVVYRKNPDGSLTIESIHTWKHEINGEVSRALLDRPTDQTEESRG